jgi:hypothetical protein
MARDFPTALASEFVPQTDTRCFLFADASILVPTNCSLHRARQDLTGSRIDPLEALCRRLNAADFLVSHTTQERFVNVLSDVWLAHFSPTPTGMLRPTNNFFVGH